MLVFGFQVHTGATGLQGIQGIQGVKGDKGEKGEKGDAFTYADFTPAQISELQKPATDKAVELNALETSLTNSESIRVQNENTRVSSENTRATTLQKPGKKPQDFSRAFGKERVLLKSYSHLNQFMENKQ